MTRGVEISLMKSRPIPPYRGYKIRIYNTLGTEVDVPIGICCNGSKPPFEGGSLGSNPSVPVKSDLFYMFRQMEKLIKLLNEHGEYGWYWDDDLGLCITWADNYENRGYVELEIISKKFGFIKWLVENEKIDLEKVKEKIGIPCFVWYKEGEISCVKDKEDYEQLLMLLSIQDEPIEFLVSILK